MSGAHSPIRKNHNWFVAEDMAFDWAIEDENDDAQNISGWTIEFRMSTNKGGATILLLTAPVSIGAAGLCGIQVQSTDTIALAPKTYYYELSRTDAGENSVVAFGDAVLQARLL